MASEGFWSLRDGENYFIVIGWEQVNLSFISDLHAYSLLSRSTSDRMKIRAIKAFTEGLSWLNIHFIIIITKSRPNYKFI